MKMYLIFFLTLDTGGFFVDISDKIKKGDNNSSQGQQELVLL